MLSHMILSKCEGVGKMWEALFFMAPFLGKYSVSDVPFTAPLGSALPEDWSSSPSVLLPVLYKVLVRVSVQKHKGSASPMRAEGPTSGDTVSPEQRNSP